MPQWRKLHVKSIESLDINDMPDDFTRLLWLLMSLVLDKEGRGLDNASWVRSRAMPLRLDVTVEMISDALNWYTERGMIQRYCVNGRKYFHIVTWHKYQATIKEADSVYPAPLQDDPVPTPDPLQTYSRPTPEQVGKKSVTDIDIDIDVDIDSDIEEDFIPAAKAAGENLSETPEEKHKARTREALSRGEAAQISLEDRFYQCFHINVSWNSKSGKLFCQWLKERPPDQTVEKFAEWWKTQDWRGRSGQPPTIYQIQELWPQAFIPAQDSPASIASEVY